VFNAELLTPVAELGGAMPFSVVSAAAMRDLGYAVNLSAAQAFSLSGSAVAVGAPRAVLRFGSDARFVGLSPRAAGRTPR
jgi:hypothetical protein